MSIFSNCTLVAAFFIQLCTLESEAASSHAGGDIFLELLKSKQHERDTISAVSYPEALDQPPEANKLVKGKQQHRGKGIKNAKWSCRQKQTFCHETDPKLYYKCTGGQKRLRKCTKGLVFNLHTGRCGAATDPHACGGGATTTVAATTTPVNCTQMDASPQCSKFGPDVCEDYAEWSRINCYGSCFCDGKGAARTVAATPAPPNCAQMDVLWDCSAYGSDICTQYPDWSKKNCYSWCFCGGKGAARTVAAATAPPNCAQMDVLWDCSAYGSDICTQYPDWSKKNCYSCCFCGGKAATTAPPNCAQLDVLSDCSVHGPDVCTKYPDWSKKNCYNWCFCGGKENFKTTPVECVDKRDCLSYMYKHPNLCTDFREWSMENCRAYCGFGCSTTTRTTLTTETTSSTTPACVDKIDNCAQYPSTVCTDSRYTNWARDICYKTCFCPKQ